jgi:hypothetical protein
MVYYYTSSVSEPASVVYLGKDKVESMHEPTQNTRNGRY